MDNVGGDPAVGVFDNRFPNASYPYVSPQPLPAAEISRFSESYWYVTVSPLMLSVIDEILPLFVPLGYV